MRIRAQDADGDMMFGRGAADFYLNMPSGVGQSIVTRLKLILGEWFLDTTQGTDWGGKIIGRHGSKSFDGEIKRVILGTAGVDSIVSYASDLESNRTLSIRAEVRTIYSATQIITIAETLAIRIPA